MWTYVRAVNYTDLRESVIIIIPNVTRKPREATRPAGRLAPNKLMLLGGREESSSPQNSG